MKCEGLQCILSESIWRVRCLLRAHKESENSIPLSVDTYLHYRLAAPEAAHFSSAPESTCHRPPFTGILHYVSQRRRRRRPATPRHLAPVPLCGAPSNTLTFRIFLTSVYAKHWQLRLCLGFWSFKCYMPRLKWLRRNIKKKPAECESKLRTKGFVICTFQYLSIKMAKKSR